jgi:hypothetical protein
MPLQSLGKIEAKNEFILDNEDSEDTLLTIKHGSTLATVPRQGRSLHEVVK